MTNKDFSYNLEQCIEQTRKLILEDSLPGDKAEDLDLSYITQELLDAYKNEAEEKNQKECYSSQDKANVACYWGNNWVVIGPNNRWAYTNNHSGNRCDPVTTGCLCGSGKRWKVTAHRVSGRYCANGAKDPRMAWARP